MEDLESMDEIGLPADDYRIFEQYKSSYHYNMLNYQGWNPGTDEVDFRDTEIAYCKRQIKTFENAKSPKWRIMFSEELIPSDQEYETAHKIIEFLESKNKADNLPYEGCEANFQKIYREQLCAFEALSSEDSDRTEKNLSAAEIDIFNEQYKVGIELYDRLFNYFLTIYRPDKLWKPIIDSLRKEAEEIIATQEFQLERKPSQNFNSFSEMVRNPPVDVIVSYMAKRKVWTDWVENTFKSSKDSSAPELIGFKTAEVVKSKIRETVETNFGFMNRKDFKKNRYILTEEEFVRIVDYVTYYFENDLNPPFDIEPIKKFNTAKGNITRAFALLFEEFYPALNNKPESYVELIKSCFQQFSEDKSHAIRGSWVKRPKNYEVEIVRSSKSPQTRNFSAK